jgi:hypothetical protein
MGIFSKLFGGTKETDNYRVRAQYKDAKYFQQEIERFEQIIAASPEPTRPFHYWSRATKLNIIMDLEYSLGKPFDSLKDIYLRALDNLVKGWNKEDPTYEDFLNLLAKGILLDIPDTEFQRLVKYLEQADKDAPEGWKPDALAWYMIRAKMKVNTNENVSTTMSPEIDQRLFDLTKLPKAEAEAAVKEYLEDWYRLRKQSPWYNSHTRDRGYSGYWAWDVAAVVKIMGLDDSSFKDNPYYPQT